MQTNRKNNGSFSFLPTGEVSLKEETGNMTREPWLMLMARKGQKPTETLCWGLTHCGTSFARIGTQEGDLINGFVHEDPYKTTLLGPYIYIVEEDEEPFTSSWYPILHKDQVLESTFSFGCLTHKTEKNGLSVQTENFIPQTFDGMIQLLKIKNSEKHKRTIQIFAINPVNIGDARDIQFSGFNTLMMGGGTFDPSINSLVWRNHFGIPFNQDSDEIKGMFGKVLFHSCSEKISSFGTKYEDFIGHYTQTLSSPEALKTGVLPCRSCEELTSALSSFIITIELEAEETKEIVISSCAIDTTSYYAKENNEVKKILQIIQNPTLARTELNTVLQSWKKDFSRLQISVPSEEILSPSFKWLQYQCAMVASLNRMKSRFHSGFEYGYGFRDILQDLLALLPTEPDNVAETLQYVASQMFSDGSVYHNFFVSAPGNRDFNACDDPLWLVYAVCEYIKETGNFDFLETFVPWADEKEGLAPSKGTILEHCIAALERVWFLSKEGMPIMFDADWNDDLSGYENHHSVMTAQMLFKACNDLAELGSFWNNAKFCKTKIKELQERALLILKTFNNHAIDPNGKIIRLIGPDFDHSKDIGSNKTDGLTFFEPVAWAGFSGIATKEQFLQAALHIEKDLYSKVGIAICQGDTELTKGNLPKDYAAWKRNAPGKKENGGAFRHLESWYIASLCSFGLGNKAWKLYRETLPAVSSDDNPFEYAAERFVYPEYVSAKASNEYGRAGHTWLTGTAPTRLRVLVENILGIKAHYSGLSITPCIPQQWKEFTAYRTFRGTGFSIQCKNPHNFESGKAEITIDGKPIIGSSIPLTFCDGKEHVVEVNIGENHEN